MALKPVPFAIGAYADDARPFTSQDCLGYLPVNAEMEGTRSPVIARQVPGLREVANLPGVTRQRGARNVEGRLCIVGDQSLIQLQTDFGAAVLGEIPGTSRVGMAHNQIANGNELLTVNGSSGYITNTVTGAHERITDTGYPGAICADYIGGIFVQVESQRRYAFNSAIANGLEYNALETFQGESKSDRIRRAIEYSGEIVLLSEQSIERFDYTGTVNELFRNKKIFGMRGCAATHAVDKLDEAVFFIGDDGSGYSMRGYELRRITSHAIEQAWSRCDLSKAYSFTWEDKGHKVWYVTFPDGFTWGYDCATQKWHRRKSFGMDRWRLAWLVKWNGEWYGGEYNSGRIYVLDWAYAMEGDQPLEREITGGVLHNGGNRLRVNALLLEWNCAGETSVYSAGVGLLIEGDLPDGNVSDVVDYDYTATGTGPFTFALIGTLPDGLTMDAAGNVTGTLEANGTFSWQVEVTDANGNTARLSDRCVVSILDMEIAGSLPDTANNVAYSQRLTIVGGVPPYANASITAGALPTTGTVTIDGDELVIEWTSGQTADVYEFTVEVEDSLGTAATSAQEVELFSTYVAYVGHVATAAAAVSILDPATNTITGTLAAGSGMRYPAITDDGLLIVGMGLNYPTKIVIATGVATALGSTASQFTTVIDDTYVYGLVFSPPKLYKARISDGAAIDDYTPTIECGGNMAWNADRSKLYMARYGGNGFTVLTVATGTLSNKGTSGAIFNQGRGIAVRASDEHVFKVGMQDFGYVPAVWHYTSTGTVLGKLAIADESQNPAISPDGTQLWVPNYDNTSGKVFVLDITGNTPVLVTTITVGSKPNTVTFSPDGLVAYVTNGTGDSVSVIDTATYTVTTTVSVNDSPRGVAVLSS